MGHLRQTGFSLLELLIVLGLMTIAAVLALSTVGNSDNQRRFEETRSKLDKIRSSIIGKPQVINGQLSINGFVADMGRLPFNLEELLINPGANSGDCDGDNTLDSDGDTDPTVDACDWTFDTTTELWHGWHGPYINAIGADYRDGWGNGDPATDNKGWDWDNTTTVGNLTVTSYGLDTDTDTTTNNLAGTESEGYGNSDLQTTIVTEQDYAVTLPSGPLQLTVTKAPFCGQCRDDDTGHQTDPNCVAAGHSWNSDLEYCVEDTATSASTCDAVASEETRWVPLFSHCSDTAYTNETDCTSAGGTWTPLVNLAACAGYTTSSYDFTEGESDVCARITRINHGTIVTGTHKSSDATVVDIAVAGQSSTGGEQFTFLPNMETDELTPVPGLTLPQGVMRVGLYIYDTATNTCTENPYPVASAQARSEVITLSSDYPPNLGTSANPIMLQWRSQ